MAKTIVNAQLINCFQAVEIKKNPASSICASTYYSEKERKHVEDFFGRDIFLRHSEEVSGDLFTFTVCGLAEKDEDVIARGN